MSSTMPPFRQLAVTLRETTERLAHDLVHCSTSPPDWSDLEWAVARSAAAMQGISALLANTLRWTGPPIWQSFLAKQREQSELRDRHIGELLERLDSAMRRAGIGCIMLKGAALRSLGLYRAGERPMGDVDLLARAADFEALASVLLSLGYTQAFATRRETVFEPHGKPIPHVAGEHVDNPLKFEIHTAIAEPLPVRQVDITTCLNLADARPGLNGYPDLGALMTHLLLHAAGNMRAHALRQIQLHDIAALASRLGDHEWQALLTGPRGAESPWWAFPPIALTARYYPGSIPTEVVNKLRALCPPVLRFATDRKMLTDVSWSNLRIHAFPGIAWSRTPLDALRFIASRVLPDHTALAELEVGLKAQPQLSRVPWYGLSHGRRIVRWLFSYPPRVQTLMSVAADLESAKTAASYPSPPPSQ